VNFEPEATKAKHRDLKTYKNIATCF